LKMTERWISTKKYYCKYCNTWIPDTKLGRQQHEISDRHKNAMSREVKRIQREEAIKRHSDPALAASQARRTAASGIEMRNSKGGAGNTAAYGYGEDADVAAYIAREKRNFRPEDIPTGTERIEVGTSRAPNIGKWTVTQVISKKDEVTDGVKKERDDDRENFEVVGGGGGGGDEKGKRERPRTPDEDDLIRFKVQEKSYPVDIKDEEDVKIPVVGFKKRKIAAKNSRISGAL